MSQELIEDTALVFFDHAKLCLNFDVPGQRDTMESDEDSLCVFLKMPGLKDEDVKLNLEDNNKFLHIEGKRNGEVRYTAYMLLPDNVDKTISSMKREMKDGTFRLTLHRVEIDDKELKTGVTANVITYFSDKLTFCLPFFVDCIFSGSCYDILRVKVKFFEMLEVCS